MSHSAKHLQAFSENRLPNVLAQKIKGGDDKRDPRPSGKKGTPPTGGIPNGPNQVVNIVLFGTN